MHEFSTSRANSTAENGYTDLWGKIVFKYAGRNVCAHNSQRSRFFYNVIGRFYDWLYTEKIQGYRDAARVVAEKYVGHNERVLDLGCGTGVLTDMILHKSSLVVGCDLSQSMIQCARKKTSYSDKSHFVVGNCLHIPLSGGFDRVLSSFMMVILPEEQQCMALSNVYNQLKPEGEAIFLTSPETAGEQWWSSEKWSDHVKTAGFKEVHIQDMMHYFRIVRAVKY